MESSTNRKNPLDAVLDGCLGLVNILLILVIVIVIADVGSMYFFNRSLQWSLEISEYVLVYMAFLGTAWLLREDGHIRFDLVIQVLPFRIKKFVEILNSLIGLLICCLVTWYGIVTVMDLHVKGIRMETVLHLPKEVVLVVIPLGTALMALQFIRRIAGLVRKRSALNSD
jgi:TRAP-type C4-dicarboxylate transport system permease small subunit